MTFSSGRRERSLMAILWPSFLAACLLEVLVFSLVDPGDLQRNGAQLEWSRTTVYSLGFFAFWLLAALSNATTLLLARPRREVNRQGGASVVAGPDRPAP